VLAARRAAASCGLGGTIARQPKKNLYETGLTKSESRRSGTRTSAEIAGLASEIDREEATTRMHGADVVSRAFRDEPRFHGGARELRPLLDVRDRAHARADGAVERDDGGAPVVAEQTW